MKRYVASASKSVMAADDQLEDTLDDKIGVVEDSFDYIMDGIHQLDSVQGEEILYDMNEYLNDTISKIAEKLV